MTFTGCVGGVINQTIPQAVAQYGRFVSVVLFACTTIGEVQGISASSPRLGSEPVISVEIQNYTNVTRLEIQHAEHHAAAIFAKAGVRISWLDFRPKKHLVQSRPDNLPPDFSIRILYTSTPIRLRQLPGSDALGECTIPSGTGLPVRGGTADVFNDRVGDASTRWGLFPGEVLGHAIVHELGHLLLGAAHSSQGVMKGSWTSGDLHLASRGKMRFLPDQAALLHRAALSLHQNPSQIVIAGR